MGASSAFSWVQLCIVLLSLWLQLTQCNVVYDRKALIINGQRRILFSGSIHYPRSTPEMWEGLIQKAKDGGLDVIDTYVFWNLHEPSPGNYNFEGRYDLVRFIKMVHEARLYVHLRIGPYICSEWNFGGFPVWLKYVPGISFRTDNAPFKSAMQKFTQKIVQLMKHEKLFESQGGPIILSQIENEYEPESKIFGAAGHAYMTWAADMAVGMGTGVPWVMCKEEDAPDPVINTCNGFYCDYFSPNKPYKPTLWTEAWTGWFTEFGGPIYKRPVEDLAFGVARFFQKGGSFINYYMYHGGTNFGRTAGGPFITTSYDYDAPIDEYGLIRQPKYGHLKELHKAVKLCEKALLNADPTVTSLGNYEQAHVFSSESGGCAAFLANYNTQSAARVTFNKMNYHLPPWSISILPDCKNVVFNTAQVGVQTSQKQFFPTNSKLQSWETFNEDISSVASDTKLTVIGLFDQLNITRDSSDYLWYTTSIDIKSSESFLRGGQHPTLTVQSAGDAMHVFINDQLSGSAYGTRKNKRFTFTGNVILHAGLNKISLLSIAVGLPNNGPHFETRNSGVLGPVVLHGLDQGSRDLSWQKWSHKVGLKGEAMNLGSPSSISAVDWTRVSLVAKNQQPLTWYKVNFDAPEGDEPLALDMGSMEKGQVWINGQSIGRYWTTYANGDCSACSYSGTFRPKNKCQFGCSHPTQQWYHVPRSWLKQSKNLLVVFEEIGGDVSKIALVRSSVSTVCAEVSENHPYIRNWLTESRAQLEEEKKPKISLHCTDGYSISAIKFSSFGTPSGSCGNFQHGTCHAPNSEAVIEKVDHIRGRVLRWAQLQQVLELMEERGRSFLNNGRILLEDLIASCDGRYNPIRNYSASELIRATNNFDPSCIIQNCSPTEAEASQYHRFIHVYHGYKMFKGFLDGRSIIVKKFMGTEDETRSLAIRDIVVSIQMSNHKNVLKLLGCCLEFPIPALVHEYATKGVVSYEGGFGAKESLLWKIRLRIAKQLANALTYLHTAFPRPIVHRDLKPNCIILDENYVPKLCNFSLSITIPPKQSYAEDNPKGTFGYVDPTYMRSGYISEKGDVYSFGVLLLVFLTGQQALNTYQEGGEYQSIISYVKSHACDGQIETIVDPKVLGEVKGDKQHLHDFLALALLCTHDSSEVRPHMIDVAKELVRIEKSILLAS